MNYKDEIKNFCSNIGLDTIGFCECMAFDELKEILTFRKENKLENEFENHNIEERVNSLIYMNSGKTIISIAFPYLYEFSKVNVRDDLYFSKYALGKDYHYTVSSYLQKICDFIKTLGGLAIHFVDSNALPERYIAKLSGVGFIGNNNMLITEKYGSYVFLGEIITDLKIEKDNEKLDRCGECSKCIDSCPTRSLNKDNNKNDPNICMSYITQKKDIEDRYFKLFKGRIFGCDTCQDVCPLNEGIKTSYIDEFKPFGFMRNISVPEILNMDNDIFNHKYKGTSCGWRGKNILKRNVLINLFSNNQIEKITIKNNNSSYIDGYYHRLFNYFNL
jgi:epoxyqueuosine reductase